MGTGFSFSEELEGGRLRLDDASAVSLPFSLASEVASGQNAHFYVRPIDVATRLQIELDIELQTGVEGEALVFQLNQGSLNFYIVERYSAASGYLVILQEYEDGAPNQPADLTLPDAPGGGWTSGWVHFSVDLQRGTHTISVATNGSAPTVKDVLSRWQTPGQLGVGFGIGVGKGLAGPWRIRYDNILITPQ